MYLSGTRTFEKNLDHFQSADDTEICFDVNCLIICK